MNKEFVPYEQALELKELGFDDDYIACYSSDGKLHSNEIWKFKEGVKAPLYQQAFRWFREKYKLEAIVQKADDFSWYKFTIYFYLSDSKGFVDSYHEFKTYEEAELACLIKLIEIFKNLKTYETRSI
jgi:hypothetical protein